METAKQTLGEVLRIDKIYTAFVQAYEAGFRFAGEYHEMWELGIVLEGEAGITSGGEIYDCKKGDLVLHRAGVFHNIWTSGGGGVKMLTVSFTGRGTERLVPCGKFALTESEWRIAELLEGELLLHAGSTEPRLSAEDGQILKNLLELLFLSLYRRKSESEAPKRDRRASQFSEITEYLCTHTDEALTVTDICAACAIGKTALKELFQVYTGVGVIQYYNTLRVERAMELMGQGRSMAEIAELLHFSSQNYFSTFFKRETGISPSRYFSND